MQAEFLRNALYRFLPSATLERVNRVIKRLQAGKFEGVLGRDVEQPPPTRYVYILASSSLTYLTGFLPQGLGTLGCSTHECWPRVIDFCGEALASFADPGKPCCARLGHEGTHHCLDSQQAPGLSRLCCITTEHSGHTIRTAVAKMDRRMGLLFVWMLARLEEEPVVVHPRVDQPRSAQTAAPALLVGAVEDTKRHWSATRLGLPCLGAS